MTGCTTSPGSTQAIIPTTATIIDVHTPAEYAQGHLDGALLLDATSPDFTTQLAQLDKDAEYAVYCRSGNRSATAVAQMRAAGFSNVTDLGSKESAAAATGKDKVK